MNGAGPSALYSAALRVVPAEVERAAFDIVGATERDVRNAISERTSRSVRIEWAAEVKSATRTGEREEVAWSPGSRLPLRIVSLVCRGYA